MSANSNVNEEYKALFNQFVQRWNDVAGDVLERQRALKAASHHYGEFKVLTAHECDWQDKLDKKLMRSTTVAADAEEISEELDVRGRVYVLSLTAHVTFPLLQDLENYLKIRPNDRILRIESMGNELVSLNIMADSVASEVRSLTERWASLEEKVLVVTLFNRSQLEILTSNHFRQKPRRNGWKTMLVEPNSVNKDLSSSTTPSLR